MAIDEVRKALRGEFRVKRLAEESGRLNGLALRVHESVGGGCGAQKLSLAFHFVVDFDAKKWLFRDCCVYGE